jgi:hypothetical protein
MESVEPEIGLAEAEAGSGVVEERGSGGRPTGTQREEEIGG